MKFSVITCTYNAAGMLQRTLDSVLCQTHAEIEHLIVDGASKDDTMSMVREYEKRVEKTENVTLKILSEKDKGLYDAMNKGIQMATGDYLVFLNAGDIFHEADTLKLLAESVADGERPAVLYGNTDIVDEDGRYLGPRRLQPPTQLTWKSFRHGMLVCHQAFYVRTDIAKRVPYDLRYRLSADVDWCIRVMKEGEKMGLTTHNSHLILCDYLDGGMTVKNHRASLIERFHVMRRHYGLFSTLLMHLWFAVRKK